MINLDDIGSRVLRGVTSAADVQTLLGEAQNLSLSLDPSVLDRIGKGLATPGDVQYLYHAVELDYSTLYNRPTADQAYAQNVQATQQAVAQAQAARFALSQSQALAEIKNQQQWQAQAQSVTQAQQTIVQAQVAADQFRANLETSRKLLKDRKDKALQIQEVLDAATA